MLHTMKSALDHARKAEREPVALPAGPPHGPALGPRGNSGGLLGQIIRGFKGSWSDGGAGLKKAFGLARTYAYAAVTKPAPGTILTALKEMQEAVRHEKGDAEHLLSAAVDRGRAAVDRTMQDNPVNNAAGVVDAGARGLWLLMVGALPALEGRFVPGAVAAAPTAAGATSPAAAHEVASWAGAYDVQALITDPSRPVHVIRQEMLEFGARCGLVGRAETVAR